MTAQRQLTRLEALAHGQAPAADAPCCPFHATGGHPDDRHGFDKAWVVYGVPSPLQQLLLTQEPRP